MAISKNELRIQLKAQGISTTKAQFNALHNSVNKTGKSMGAMAGQVGMATVAFYAAARALGSVISTGKEFEQSMANVKAISKATNKEFSMLSQSAKNLGATTVFTASQVAELQTEFAKLGFTAEEITKVTANTLALASATGSDLATAAGTAGATLRGFGLNVSETARVTDVMALSFSKSALDMAKFTDSMKYVAPIAKAAGVDLEGTTAILGQLANAGISGSMAGTSLRKILLEAGNAGSKLAERMGGPITSFEDFQSKMRDLRDQGLDPLSEGADLVGKRAVTAFGILLEGVDSVDKLGEAFNDSAGAAREMQKVMEDTFEGSLKLAGSAVDGLKIKMFELNEQALKEVVQNFTRFIDSIDEEDILAFEAALKIVVAGLIAYNVKIGLATWATRGFTMALTSTGIGAIAVGLGILTAKLIDYTDVLKPLPDEEEEAAKAALELADSIARQEQEVRKLIAAYKDLSLAEAQSQWDELNDKLLKAAQHQFKVNGELYKLEGLLEKNTTKGGSWTSDIKNQIEALKIEKVEIDALVETYGTQYAAIDKIIENYKNLEDNKPTPDESKESPVIAGVPSSDELVKAQNEINDFYINNFGTEQEIRTRKLNMEETYYLNLAEITGAGEAEIQVIKDKFAEMRAEANETSGGGGGGGGLVPSEDEMLAAQERLNEFYLEEYATDEERALVKIAQKEEEYLALANVVGAGEAELQAIKDTFDKKRIQAKKKIDQLELQNKMALYGNLLGAFSSFSSNFAGGEKIAARLQQAKAIVDTYSAANKAWNIHGGYPGGVVPAGATIAAGMANVMAIGQAIGDFKAAAVGMDEVVDKPTLILAGEAGAEQVSITPLEGPNIEGPQSAPLNITISGNVMSENYTEYIIIPDIKEALRRGEDMG